MRPNDNDLQRAISKQVLKQERASSTQRRRAAAKRYNSDLNGNKLIDECRICGSTNVIPHKHHGTMCIICGNLYDRTMKHELTAAKKLKTRMRNKNETLLTFINKLEKERPIMSKTKTCVQCGRTLPISSYRPYTPRGKGIYNTTVGHHTVCRECENFNQAVAVAYKSEARTPRQVALLEQAKVLYETLHARGLAPKGRYAADVLGLTKAVKKTSVDKYLAELMGTGDELKGTDDPLIDEYNKLLTIDLTEAPDVYQAMLDELLERSLGPDGRVRPEYKEIFTKVAERIDEYEDNYIW